MLNRALTGAAEIGRTVKLGARWTPGLEKGRSMRLTLFGFNALALAMLVAPAFLIFNSMHGAGASLPAFVAVFGFGSIATLTAMGMLSRKGIDPTRGILLLSLGLVLLTVGFGWLFFASLGQ